MAIRIDVYNCSNSQQIELLKSNNSFYFLFFNVAQIESFWKFHEIYCLLILLLFEQFIKTWLEREIKDSVIVTHKTVFTPESNKRKLLSWSAFKRQPIVNFKSFWTQPSNSFPWTNSKRLFKRSFSLSSTKQFSWKSFTKLHQLLFSHQKLSSFQGFSNSKEIKIKLQRFEKSKKNIWKFN